MGSITCTPFLVLVIVLLCVAHPFAFRKSFTKSHSLFVLFLYYSPGVATG